MALELIAGRPTVRLELTSTPGCVTLVRGVLGGVAELLALEPVLLDDLKTAVSEACNNVVVHAYGDEPGPLVVEIAVNETGLGVIVRDWGSGIGSAGPSEDRMGVGLAVINALTERAEFLRVADGGTEVRMAFSVVGAGASVGEPAAAAMPGRDSGSELSGDAVVSLSLDLLSAVLGRLARALAARAHFSLERFSDIYLVTDALAEHAQLAASGSRIDFALVADHRRLQLTIGPFQPGSGAQLQPDGANPETELRIGRITDELTVEPAGGTEMLRVVLADRRGR